MPDSDSRPSLVWFKAQIPGARLDGSSMVTLSMANELAKGWDLHLVCLPTPSRFDRGAPPDQLSPFASVTVAVPAHQRSRLHRWILGACYLGLDVLGLRPLAASVETSRPVRRTVEAVAERTGAKAAIVEYWTAGGLVNSLRSIPTTLVLHDVAHAAPQRSAIGRWRAAAVRRSEFSACRRATKVVFLSAEDRIDFDQAGLANAVTVPVPMALPLRRDLRTFSGETVVFVGGLDWWPNREGLIWLLDHVWPKVLRQRPNATLKVIGSGSAGRSDPGVLFAGFVSDLENELRRARVGVVPTLSGTGVKTKTLEMLRAQLPIVATVNGTRGTSAQVAGALVTNDPDEFAANIISLLSDQARCRAIVDEGYEVLARSHSPEGLAGQFLPAAESVP